MEAVGQLPGFADVAAITAAVVKEDDAEVEFPGYGDKDPVDARSSSAAVDCDCAVAAGVAAAVAVAAAACRQSRSTSNPAILSMSTCPTCAPAMRRAARFTIAPKKSARPVLVWGTTERGTPVKIPTLARKPLWMSMRV